MSVLERADIGLGPAVSPSLPSGTADLALPRWGWRECLVGLAAAIVGLVLLFTIVASLINSGVVGKPDSVGGLFVGLMATVALEALLFGIAAGLTAGKFDGGFALLGWVRRPIFAWLGWSALAVVLAWITLAVYAGVTNLLPFSDLRPQSNVPSGIFDHRQTVALGVFLTVVTAPIAEETFFRGFMFNGLRRRLGFAGAATTSGMLFAFAHSAPSLIIPFTVIGVIFAYTYRRTGTLWANVTAHCCFNLVSVLVFLTKGGG